MEVVLFEREHVAAGASGRNSGVVQQPFDPALAELHHETLATYRRLAEDGTGFDIGSSPMGLLLLSADAVVAARAAAEIERSAPALQPVVVDADDLRKLEPTLAPGLVACRLETGYPVDPGGATRAFAWLAERRGVRLRIGDEAVPVIDQGRVNGVVLPSGEIVSSERCSSPPARGRRSSSPAGETIHRSARSGAWSSAHRCRRHPSTCSRSWDSTVRGPSPRRCSASFEWASRSASARRSRPSGPIPADPWGRSSSAPGDSCPPWPARQLTACECVRARQPWMAGHSSERYGRRGHVRVRGARALGHLDRSGVGAAGDRHHAWQWARAGRIRALTSDHGRGSDRLGVTPLGHV